MMDDSFGREPELSESVSDNTGVDATGALGAGVAAGDDGAFAVGGAVGSASAAGSAVDSTAATDSTSAAGGVVSSTELSEEERKRLAQQEFKKRFKRLKSGGKF